MVTVQPFEQIVAARLSWETLGLIDPERLQRLADLRRDGSLTEEEFAAAKVRAIS